MIHLFAYLLARRSDGSWNVTSHRNLEGLTLDWKACLEFDSASSAVVHVGFWRPDTTSFDLLCSTYQGRVLLTEAAKHALPNNFSTAQYPCGAVENLSIYLALSGWGYQIDEVCIGSTILGNKPLRQVALTEIPTTPFGWLEDLARDAPDLFIECAKHSILNEAIYQQREHLLPPSVRDRLGIYRFKRLAGYQPSHDVMVDGLLFAPPWVLRLSTSALDSTVRASNCLRHIGAVIVNDIAQMGTDGLKQIPNLGKKTVSDISEAIYTAFEFGSAYCDSYAGTQELHAHSLRRNLPEVIVGQASPLVPTSDNAISKNVLEPSSFLEALHAACALLDEREDSILRQRMGLGRSKKTLEEVAKNYSITRERIRQLELKAVNRIKARMPVWEKRFKEALSKMLAGRCTPLPLLGLEVIDLWFVGIDSLISPFKFSIEQFIDPAEFYLVRIAGHFYVSKLSQDEWNEVEKAARKMMVSLSKQQKTTKESEAKLLIESQLVGKGEELRPLLWEAVTHWAHFSEGLVGERILVSYGTGAESLVEVILAESDRPLHYSEIAKRCALKGRTVDIRRVANAAMNVGYLLGRGSYGLQKHINLSEDEQSRILGEVEEMLSDTPGRQWHTAEICDELEARGLNFDGRLSKYEVNVILGSSMVLAYLRRMVWVTRTTMSLGASDRLNIWQAIVALLQKHGAPMCISDIREVISKDRGLSSHFQVHQADPLIRVGENEWGILWRDVPFDENIAHAIVEEMISNLKARESGLHMSEILSSFNIHREIVANINPNLLVALAVRSELVKLGRGGYIYLQEWGESRRLTVGEAVEKAFDLFDEGVLSADVAKKATDLLGRDVSSNTAAGILMKIGDYNSAKGLWFHYKDMVETPDDSDHASEDKFYA